MPWLRRQSMSRRPGLNCVAVDAAGPDRDVAVHALGAQHRGEGFGRNQQRVAAAVEAAHDRADQRLEHLQMIISEIGVEPGVDRSDDRDVARPRPADRAVGDDVGAGDMDDVGRELGKVAADARGSSAIGMRYSRRVGMENDGTWTISPVARKGGVFDRRGINADLRALAQQIADQPVERLVGAVEDIIVIAREEGDAKVAGLHRSGPYRGAGERPNGRARWR